MDEENDPSARRRGRQMYFDQTRKRFQSKVLLGTL